MSKLSALRKQVFIVLFKGFNGPASSKCFDSFILSLIVVNLFFVFQEALYVLSARAIQIIANVEWAIIVFFSIEYILRIWSCVDNDEHAGTGSNFKKRLRYAVSPMAIIDLLAVLPFVIVSFYGFDGDIRMIKTFQMIRILKLSRVFSHLQLLTDVLKLNMMPFFSTLILIMNLLLFSAIGIYWFEKDIQPDAFGNIPKALWWSLITITTIGYGDAIPVTVGGKVFSFVVILAGISVIGIPISIFTSSLQEELRKKKNLHKFIDAKASGHNTGELGEQAYQYAKEHGIANVHVAKSLDYVTENATKETEKSFEGEEFGIPCPHCKKTIRFEHKREA